MAASQTIFESCEPRADVLSGATKDEQFAADLSQVVRASAPESYTNATLFFRNSHPTRGMQELLKAVCKRLSGSGGEVGSVLRLDTQYGGGKTHALIALYHAVRGMKGVENASEFIDPALVPRGEVRVAALDGETSDPSNGLTLEGDLRAFSLWGEMAYQLGGVEAYRRIENSDRSHTAPGAETIRELFGGQPVLIMVDEVSLYLRKVETAFPGRGDQFSAFLQSLIKAVESSPKAVLVFTLAVGKDGEAQDAYKAEQVRASQALAEAQSVAARKATLLNPTEEDETVDVIRRRMFESVNKEAAEAAVDAYADLWGRNQLGLPRNAVTPEVKDLFRRGYPFHPETLALLTEKTASLSNFQRIRGMVRLLARTIHKLWQDKPADALAIHPHHIDPGFGPIRDELTTRLQQGHYTAALKSDVAAVSGDDPAIAQKLDEQHNPGQPPIVSYVARTIFLNTLAHGDAAKGISPEHLRFSACSPVVEPEFVERARVQFVGESLYLDDKPGAPMRLMVEPNLEQIIRRRMREIDSDEVRVELNERIYDLFGGKGGGKFQVIKFPGGPYEVPDEIGDGRPLLVLMGYDAFAIGLDSRGVPPDIAEIFQRKGSNLDYREYRNNLVFVVADERGRENMKDRVRRRLALKALRDEGIQHLADYQQRKIFQEGEQSRFHVAESIFHCYRHLFYPSNHSMEGSDLPIAHAALELSQVSDKPGDGQLFVARILRDHHKLLDVGDPPEAPAFVRDQTPLKSKGELTVLALRNEFRRAPKLSMLLSDDPLTAVIRRGVESEVFLYREGDQLWGKDDPTPTIRVRDDAFVHTIDDARRKKLWPRPEALEVELEVSSDRVPPGDEVTLSVRVSGGSPPYSFHSEEPKLCLAPSSQTVLTASIAPSASTTYQVEVTDGRGTKAGASRMIQVDASATPVGVTERGDTKLKPGPVSPPEPTGPKSLTAEGPLAQALAELWEQARKAKVGAFERLEIRFFAPAPAWQVQSALASMAREVEVSCTLEIGIEADGIEKLQVDFSGRLDKATTIKGLLDAQLRAASNVDFEASYVLRFSTPLPIAADKTEAFTKALTKYGSGEAFVEAHAAEATGKEVPS